MSTVPRASAASVPHLRGHPLVGMLFEIAKDPLAFLEEVATHGDVVRTRVGFTHLVVVSHPELVQEVLLTHAGKTHKDRVTRSLRLVLGEGLLTSEDDHWRRQRKRIAPSLTPRQIAGYGRTMVDSLVQRMPTAGEHDVLELWSEVAMDAVIRTLFGTEPAAEAHEVPELLERLMGAFETENRSLWRLLPRSIPARHRRLVWRTTAQLDALLATLVARGRAGAEERDDLLARLVCAQDDAGQGMGDEELRDELLTLILAGHETTALALSYTCWLLATHPGVQERVHAELDATPKGLPRAEQVRDWPVLSAVVDEAMRLYPPIWAVGRAVIQPFEVAGHPVGVGEQLTFSPWVIQRDPRWFDDPLTFDPDRWLGAKERPRFSYFPFGGGPRVCVGNHFALLEIRLMLATLLQRFQLVEVAGYAPRLRAAVTLRVRNGVQVGLVVR
ncbi:MAG: cytochrome P450 [Myxococcales bacterium]|nr:cytochrome P450 [Myxococcales bacterium]